MLAKDSVKSRLEGGISFTEFSYMLLQAYDFLELHRREGCTLQTGGSDQWGNITAGIELIKRAAGGDAHGLVLPLVTTAAGTKFGKTEAGAIWLDPKRTSVYRFFQFWVNADDRDVGRYLRFFTLLSANEIAALDTATRESPERREAQQVLALDVTTRVHGADAARVASEVSGILFGRGDPRTLSPDALAALAAEIPSSTLDGDGSTAIDVVDAFVTAGLAPSKGAARRLLDQGGLSVNGRRLAPSDRTLPPDDALAGRYYLLRKGSRDYALLKRAGTAGSGIRDPRSETAT
jgi:tyrosyl-tRNA synthetase